MKENGLPIICRIRRYLFGASPSCIFAGCPLGLRISDKCLKCSGYDGMGYESFERWHQKLMDKIEN